MSFHVLVFGFAKKFISGKYIKVMKAIKTNKQIKPPNHKSP